MRKQYLFFGCFTLFAALMGCNNKTKNMTYDHTNALANETSPYLLQHAHNPVNWMPWKPEVLKKAQTENKPVLISIGYAACHWCHVMEHECFEDEAVATYMNEHFVNIKVDREERPDVDQIYMDALQMMTGNGGWPLNIVALPDGTPFWGATYLPKEKWLKSLKSLTELYQNNQQKIMAYAENMEKGLKAVNLIAPSTDNELFTLDSLQTAIGQWQTNFDNTLGGYKHAPKFMMPNNLDFLLHYGTSAGANEILAYVDTTLTRMAYGGIYDHIGGGFSRYSVDQKWHIPHFEKMLYDNAQLVSLYAKAFAKTKNPLYKKVVDETIAFIRTEMTHSTGGFYSSLDADSKNAQGKLEEGAFYVWTEKELDPLLSEKDLTNFKAYYNINAYGHWKNDRYVLIKDDSDQVAAKKLGISTEELQSSLKKSLAILKKVRKKRPRPRLDDKILTAWNGLMLQGLVDAYRYLGDAQYLDMALQNVSFLESKMMKEDGGLYRNHKNGKSTINAFLDDYATVIQALISLYEVTFEIKWLEQAQKLTHYCTENFKDPETSLFFYTSQADAPLIRRSIETDDNVISSSNSIMAKNLNRLQKIYPDKGYGPSARQMLLNVQANFKEHAQGFANWLHLILFMRKDFYEIAVLGENYRELATEISANYLPNSIVLGSDKEEAIELLKHRFVPNKNLIYVCVEGSCKLPVAAVDDALKQLTH